MEIKVNSYYWYKDTLLKITGYNVESKGIKRNAGKWYKYQAYCGDFFKNENPKDCLFCEDSIMAEGLTIATKTDRILYGA